MSPVADCEPGGERWRFVEADRRYQVSSHGRVIGPRGKILKATETNRGYLKVCLGGGRKPGSQRYVHDLVALAFHGDRPPGHEVDHVDTDRHHNCVRNLRWLPAPTNGQRFRWIARRAGRNVWEIEDEHAPAPCDHEPLTAEQEAELLADLAAKGWVEPVP